MARPVVLSYSGGKDCTYALHVLNQDPDWQVVRLLTTATRDYRRTSMHGVRIELLRRQAPRHRLAGGGRGRPGLREPHGGNACRVQKAGN
ncbi:MAG: hypothetical protein AB2404_09440 [Planifilum fimeticola]